MKKILLVLTVLGMFLLTACGYVLEGVTVTDKHYETEAFITTFYIDVKKGENKYSYQVDKNNYVLAQVGSTYNAKVSPNTTGFAVLTPVGTIKN